MNPKGADPIVGWRGSPAPVLDWVRLDVRMTRILTILVLAGFLAGMLPPATCRGMDSCCCAKGKAGQTATPTAAPKGACPAHARATAAAPASALDSRCPCTPEMRGCAPDRDPGTPAQTPTAVRPAATPATPGSTPLQLALATHATGIPAAIAEPPPPLSTATRHTVLRI